MASTISNKPCFAICYGFMEGRLHGHNLKKLLKSQALQNSNLRQADIIIAHSAGCWLIPKDAQPKLIFYVGMPLVTTHTNTKLISVTITSFIKGNSLKNLSIRFKNTCHGVADVRRNYRIMRNPQFGKPQTFENAQSIFIANRYDEWPRGPLLEKLLKKKSWTFISLSGTHEDIWENPDRYADIIKQYAERILD